ncbi:hypothetical protein A3Q56_00108 [Intoshia linei]|uniref:choline-phosphate cytidylyltransferase n=1 Tax=Intoshia linei TaxID=1819745 RepID=A0A177BEJ3_9BILA|nr:hypothetical protein A3Q56_00108 [Intoshia linei]
MAIFTRKCCIYSLCVIGVIALCLGVAAWIFMPKLIHKMIYKKLVINEESKSYDMWIKSTTPVYFSFSFYNVTNVPEIFGGAKPIVNEVGPYVYRKQKEKVDVVFTDRGTVRFKEKTVYTFQKEMSIGPETDVITTIDLIGVVLLSVAEHGTENLKDDIYMIFDHPYNLQFFNNFTINEYVWGYTNQALVEFNRRMYTDKPTFFGILSKPTSKNNSISVESEIYTGENTNHQIGEYYAYDNKTKLTYWGDEYANKLNGTDGTGWSPSIDKNNILYLYSPDLCRSIPFIFHNDTLVQGIDTFQYVPRPAMSELPNVNPDNAAFCFNGCLNSTMYNNTALVKKCCLGRGALNLFNCKKGEFITTGVHFLGAEQFLNDSIGVKEPVKETDETWLKIDPITGKVLCAKKLIQTNAHITNVDLLEFVGNTDLKMLNEYIFPLFYVEESGCLTVESSEKLKNKVYSKLNIIKILPYVIIAVGGTLLLLFIFCYCKNRKLLHTKKMNAKRKTSENKITIKKMKFDANEDNLCNGRPVALPSDKFTIDLDLKYSSDVCIGAPFTNSPQAQKERDSIDYSYKISKKLILDNKVKRRVRVYADGVYDMFHSGHARQLMQAKHMLPNCNVYLIVGVVGDADTHRLKGRTVMHEKERFESVRHCRYVDEVLTYAPWSIDEEFLKTNKIDFVAHDDIPYTSSGNNDIYGDLKNKNMFLPTKRSECISTTEVVAAIIKGYDIYARRNLKRGYTAKQLNIGFVHEKRLQLSDQIENIRNKGNYYRRQFQSKKEIVLKKWERMSSTFIQSFVDLFEKGTNWLHFDKVELSSDQNSESESNTSNSSEPQNGNYASA